MEEIDPMNRTLMLFLFCVQIIFAQKEIPTDYFDNPLKIPLELSGTFGELRSNHFHAGLDIRTQQREGIPVYAPADGYVNRIKVSHFGYGKALYIQHPNGYSTVYAHLREYAGAIQDYVKKEQYKKQSYEVEMFPGAGELQVKKGDLIGYTGNTGSSGGPHLHYEIRDASSRPMNPKLFGVDITDSRKPLINSVFVYPIGEDAHVNQDANLKQLRLIPQKDGNYVTEKISAFGTLGFGVSAVDQQDSANNRNGVYKIETFYNGQQKMDVVFDRISFDETRYVNRYTDYAYNAEHKTRIQKLFIEKNNPLSIFKNSHQNGFVTVADSTDGVYTIVVSDFKENTVTVTIPVEGKQLPIKNLKTQPEYTHHIFAREGSEIVTENFKVYIPGGALYDDAYLQVSEKDGVLYLHKDNIPIQNNITIQADVSHIDTKDKDKVYIGKLNNKGEVSYLNTNRSGNTLSAKTRNFGNFTLAVDSNPPTIVPVNFADKQWISNNKTLELKIEDKETGIKGYRATVNGKWILMEYEHKKNLLTYNFDDGVISDSENNLQVIVTDNVGNSTKFEAVFYRKN